MGNASSGMVRYVGMSLQELGPQRSSGAIPKGTCLGLELGFCHQLLCVLTSPVFGSDQAPRGFLHCSCSAGLNLVPPFQKRSHPCSGALAGHGAVGLPA